MPRNALPSRRLAAGTLLAHAQPWLQVAVTLDSPALDVMTDLTQVKAATTGPGTTLRQAEQHMIYQGVRMLFVVTDMPSIEGLVTDTDLHGDKPMRLVSERGVHHDEVTVADVMTPLHLLDAVEFDRMRGATVANVIATLQRFGRNHMLVVDTMSSGATRVRGILSRAQIERQLGSPVVITEIAHSFAEIEKALA